MVNVIKDTVDILLWNSMKTPAFQAASSFYETNREVPAFFFQNCRKFL